MDEKDLASVLQKHPAAIENPQQLVGILRDYYPAEQRNIRLLKQALDIDILREIRTNPMDQPLMLRLRKRLMDEFFLQGDKAEWTVFMWCYAYGYGILGKAIPIQPAPTSALQPQPAPPKPTSAPTQPKPATPLKPVQQPKPVQQLRPQPAPRPGKPAAASIDMSHFELVNNSGVILFSPWGPFTRTVVSSKTLVKYVGPGGNVVIPQGVTGIAAWAFSTSPRDRAKTNVLACLGSVLVREVELSIKNVVIPQGVTAIGFCAFDGCSNLQSITIPQSVTEIGKFAFSDCSSLRDITIPQGVKYIGDHLFSGCSSLRSVTIPKGIVSIEDHAFYGCSSLQNIVIPQGVTEIRAYAFSGCSSLLNVTIPQGVDFIGAEAFSGCSSLQNVVLPQGVTLFADVFKGCSNLRVRPGGELDTTSVDMSHFEFDSTCHVLKKYIGPGGDVVIPRGVISIGEEAFSGCATLTSVKIPQGAAYIGRDAFWDCANLLSVTVAPGVTRIGHSAFGRCPKLKSVTLPKSVKEIYPRTFPYRGKLTFHPLTIYAPDGSYAQTYAYENDLRFRTI